MKDGTEAADPRLGRLRQFDEQSRAYPVRALVARPQPRSYTWRMDEAALNQGSIGACVAYSIGHEALARPGPLAWPDRLDRRFLLAAYCAAQQIDEWPGTDARSVCGTDAAAPHYGGTSVLAGLKTFHRLGFFREYRWAFGIEDCIVALGRNGPAVVGTSWLAGMERPDSAGRIHATGDELGGHAYLLDAVDVSGGPWLDGDVRMLNSWGARWGDGGRAVLSIRDLARLLEGWGEAAFAVRRSTTPTGLQ